MRTAAVIGLLLSSLAGGCSARVEAPPEYVLEGQILAIRPDTQEVLIRHGDIKGFMPGMTMPFRVENPGLLQGRVAGDLVKATLVVGPERAVLRTLERTGSAPLPADAPKDLPAAAGVHVVEPGDEVPATPLVSSAGTLALTGFKGRAVAVTFIYTRCPLPDFCPLMDRRFAEVQGLAAQNPRLAGRISLVSISFDPAADTPAVLAEHARSLGADPAVWRFATIATPEAVDRFAAAFGVNVIRESDGTITHNLRTVVIDPAGKVVRVHDGRDWSAADLVRDLAAALGG